MTPARAGPAERRHVVLAWEMGGGLGNVGRLVPLVRAFRARRWRVTLVLKDPVRARAWIADDEAALLQAPRIRVDPGLRLAALNASSLLSEGGWLQARPLRALLTAWSGLLGRLRPDLLLCEYAPAAKLAARQLPGLAAFNVGASVAIPVIGDPMPPLRWWQPTAGGRDIIEHCREIDDLMLSLINRVLASLRWPALDRMAALWPEENSLLCSIPPLDYGARFGRPRPCWRIVENAGDRVAPPKWPLAGDERVLVYLKGDPVRLAKILGVLSKLELCCLVVAPDAPAALLERFEGPRMRFSPPVGVAAALRESSLVVGNGTHGVCAQALAAGVPLLMSPYVLEQRLNATAVEEVGAGLRVRDAASSHDIAEQVRRLLADASIRQVTQQFAAADWARRSVDESAAALVEHCIGKCSGMAA